MPALTVEQADRLADQALRLKIAVGDFRNQFFDTLTPVQRDGLRTLAVELGDETDHLTAVAIKLSLADLQGSLAHLKDVTGGITDAVAHLREVRKIITVATALVDLGAAIVTADPGAVIEALKATATSIQA